MNNNIISSKRVLFDDSDDLLSLTNSDDLLSVTNSPFPKKFKYDLFENTNRKEIRQLFNDVPIKSKNELDSNQYYFECTLDISYIVLIIKEILDHFATKEANQRSNIDYEYKNYKWEVVIINASQRYDFEISIYIDEHKSSFIIEFTLLPGDCIFFVDLFYDIFYETKSYFTGKPKEISSILGCTDNYLSDEGVKIELESITKMINDKEEHNSYIAAQILCDLIFCKNDIKDKLLKSGCIQMLSTLLDSNREETIRCVIIGLSELSENHNCSIQIASDIKIVSFLNNFKKEENHKTAAIHRAVKKCISKISQFY